MDADDLARRCLQRVGVIPEPPPTLTELWEAMVRECWEDYQQRIQAIRAQRDAYQRRIEIGREYPGVMETLRWCVATQNKQLAVWEALEILFNAQDDLVIKTATRSLDEALNMSADEHWDIALFTPLLVESPAAKAYQKAYFERWTWTP